MEQFSLEKYLENPNRKVVTRDGRKVRIICTDAKGKCPVVGLVDYENYEVALNVTKNGKIDGALDLFFAPEKHEGWINLLKSNSTIITGKVYNTKEEAESAVLGSLIYISTVKIEWEE